LKNNPSIYFDTWRKRNFKKLIKAYTKVAVTYPNKTLMRVNFGDFLDRYVDSRGAYTGTVKQWNSAYILGRELGVFYTENAQSGYELSPLAKATLTSQITLDEYLLIYLLNLNQIINGKIVHPLKEVLDIFSVNDSITINDIINIPAFNLKVKTSDNQRQLAKVLLYRLVEARVLVKTGQSTYRLDTKFELNDLYDSLNEFNGTLDELLSYTHEQYVEMLSQPVKLIPHYRP
jgi:hypothetical protein